MWDCFSVEIMDLVANSFFDLAFSMFKWICDVRLLSRFVPY